jgi:hypothetical protein
LVLVPWNVPVRDTAWDTERRPTRRASSIAATCRESGTGSRSVGSAASPARTSGPRCKRRRRRTSARQDLCHSPVPELRPAWRQYVRPARTTVRAGTVAQAAWHAARELPQAVPCGRLMGKNASRLPAGRFTPKSARRTPATRSSVCRRRSGSSDGKRQPMNPTSTSIKSSARSQIGRWAATTMMIQTTATAMSIPTSVPMARAVTRPGMPLIARPATGWLPGHVWRRRRCRPSRSPRSLARRSTH